MRNLILLCSLCIGFGLQAQSNDWFAPVGATWTYYDYTDAPPHYYAQRPYFQAKVVKDSVILGRECRKLQAFDADGTLRENSTVWLHVDSNRVYFLKQDTFFLFFRKDLKVGDTLTYTMPDNYWNYDFTCCTPKRLIHRVDSIDTVVIGGLSLKRWYFDKWDPYQNYFIEKIGFAPFFGAGGVCCLGGFWGEFHCYEDQATFINTDTVDCTYPVGIESPETESIQIAPNPTSGHFEITLPASSDLTSAKASVYSLDGRLILEADLPNRNNKLNFDLPAGLYLVQVQSVERQYIERLSLIR